MSDTHTLHVDRCTLCVCVSSTLGKCLTKDPARDLDPSRNLTIASFDWEAAAELEPPALVVWLHPSKDPTQRKKRYPMLIQRRHPLPSGNAAADAAAGSVPPGWGWSTASSTASCAASCTVS